MVNLIAYIVEGLDEKKHVLGVIIDLAKIFVNKLEWCQRHSLSWLKYLVTKLSHCVIARKLSGQVELNCSVAQGSVLGSILFLLYVNDLSA